MEELTFHSLQRLHFSISYFSTIFIFHSYFQPFLFFNQFSTIFMITFTFPTTYQPLFNLLCIYVWSCIILQQHPQSVLASSCIHFSIHTESISSSLIRSLWRGQHFTSHNAISQPPPYVWSRTIPQQHPLLISSAIHFSRYSTPVSSSTVNVEGSTFHFPQRFCSPPLYTRKKVVKEGLIYPPRASKGRIIRHFAA